MASDRHQQLRAQFSAEKNEPLPFLSTRSKNHYLQTPNTFCKWCLKKKRLGSNPIIDVEMIEKRGDVRRARRALTEDEVRRLFDHMDERYRLVYRFALCTGLRRNELSELVWGDLHFNDPTPHVLLRAETTKANRAD